MTRKDWLMNGDRNSRYFHQSMKVRKTRSKITKIKDNLGVWIDKSAQIENMFIADFTIGFKSAQTATSEIEMEILNLVTVQDNQRLSNPFKIQKLRMLFFKWTSLKLLGLMVSERLSFKITSILFRMKFAMQ